MEERESQPSSARSSFATRCSALSTLIAQGGVVEPKEDDEEDDEEEEEEEEEEDDEESVASISPESLARTAVLVKGKKREGRGKWEAF